jgi:signal peptidase I
MIPNQSQPKQTFPAPQPLPPRDNSTERFNHKESIKNVVYTVLLFILAPLFALFMIMFCFQSYVVDGSSMEPTLQNGNRVFILKLPKTWAKIRGNQYVPARYDVVVFKKPTDPNVQLIKRVVGLPGDRVVVKDNIITIYNNDNPNGFNPDADASYATTSEDADGNVDLTVGDGMLFVCGDNRNPGGSLDSRNSLGLVPVENVVGRLWVRYYPLSDFKYFSALEYAQRFWQILPLSYRL